MSSMTRGRPPLPPPHGSYSDTSRNEGSKPPQKLSEAKPLPAARALPLPKHDPLVEKTLMEAHRYLEQEKSIQPKPEPLPRRRLASFGGLGSTGSLSPFTGLGAYNQNNNRNKSTDAGGDLSVRLSSSLGIRGSTGSLKLSPQNSGRSTPVTGLSPMHLQHVRDQMMVALQRLKELEEQVKTIPILQVKISVLQEEKRQLVSQFKNQNGHQDLNDVFRKRTRSTGSSDHPWKVSGLEKEVKIERGLESIVKSDCTGLREFRQLTEEMQALERTIKSGCLQAPHGLRNSTRHVKPTKSVAVGTDEDVEIILSEPTKKNKYACVDTETRSTAKEEYTCVDTETRSTAKEEFEVDFEIVAEREAALKAQQQTIVMLKERICELESELKESALQTEMSRLKFELQAAEARNKVNKASIAKPPTENIGTEARTHTRSQGVGTHTELRDACIWGREGVQRCTVGVSCELEVRSVSTGPDLPMSHWEVKERVESREQCVGIQVMTKTQAVGTEIKMTDAVTNTDITMEILRSEEGKREYCSVACGDCSADMTITEAREVMCLGMATDPIRGVDLGIMASPQTASQHTNTVSSSVSRFTNTKHAFNTNSSTNTVLNTQEKHTNTVQTATKTTSAGYRIQDIQGGSDIHAFGAGAAAVIGNTFKNTSVKLPKKTTRDTGVGFANIYENFLVGLKTRNMACGPSHLPDPNKTRSIGVGEGKIRNLSAPSQISGPTAQHSTQFRGDPDLNHYIEKMQMLLGQQQGPLTEICGGLGAGFDQQHGSLGNTSSKLPCAVMTPGGRDVCSLESQLAASRPFQMKGDFPNSDKAKPDICQVNCNDSDVKRKIQMIEQHALSVLQDRSTNASLRSIMKKQNGDQSSSNRQNLKFLSLTTGLEPVSSHEPSTCRAAYFDEEEVKGNRKWREISGLCNHVGFQDGHDKSMCNRDMGDFVTPETQQSFSLSDRMISACETLRTSLGGNASVSASDLHACLHTLQQEWFCVSSRKSAFPSVVKHYLSAFRGISPLVLRYVANMADDNGNTALHYSVSHSNFSIVKQLLDAGVCNVNQQNKAGYTPIMLAALAAVETPDDMRVVEELFTKGDVNAKASQAGQTALMLAVSHGRMDMVQALLAQGAQVNLQDDEGSTALMCASEHGHAHIVRLLIAQPGCDATLSDSDESTALSIALEVGRRDIAVLLYAHANFSKGQAGGTAHLGSKSHSWSGRRSVVE
ncbi:KN motif and ankyrin repeat domain-containing protein 1-like [Lampris incognitus]|uniref:KN motif and ankyrin repeat domain-containing protein 1-like n=1 Tax=Lampris incognitus TaxID=2546036 RepID=UPI0024B5CAC2|nr:KN motif and ankyrin repeat domain-containing protein 1-like [Lampris incognitus]